MTLLELLVAVALLAIITSMAYRGLDSLMRSSDRLLAERQRWQAIALFFARFDNDVRQPVARPIRTGPLSAPPQPGLLPTTVSDPSLLPAWRARPLPALPADAGSDASLLEFTRKSPTGRNELRLAYRLRDSQIELLLWPALDRLPDTRPEIYPLLDGVRTLQLRYLDTTGNWQDSWPPVGLANDSLPRAIELELTLQDGTRLRRFFALPS